MTRTIAILVTHPLALVLHLFVVGSIRAQYLNSPCPDIFTYQVDPGTRQIFGYIELDNLRVGNVAKLNVDLSIATSLPPNNVGSITLIKSREATFHDITNGLPAQYRVNFPLQNILPSVLSIALNGQTICTGSRAQGHQVITTINLEHTLYTQLAPLNNANGFNNNNNNLNGFQYQRPVETNPVIYQPRPQPQPQPETNMFYPKPEPRPQPVYPEPTPRPQPRPTEYRPQTTLATRPVPARTTVTPPQSSANYACGKPSGSFLNRLALNGERVDKGQFPWIVPLFDRIQQRSPQYICGSTIITKKFLVTAAHCVYDSDDVIPPERVLAVPGMYNLENFFDDNAKFAYVEKVTVHEDYVQDDDLNDADIAVLKLQKDLIWTDYVIPICPWQGENDLTKVLGQQGVVAGWGITEKGSTNVPTYIKPVIVSRRDCSSNLSRMYPTNARIFCGDGQGSAPCNGDSGSGMVLKKGNQYYLRGVVSKGQVDHNTLKCDVTKYAIYTDIAPFRFWLKDVTSD